MAKALVLAGGFDQIALIEELKARDYTVILADYYKNPMAKSVADKHYQISTLDIESVAEVAKKEEVDIITTACTDQALLTVARVSELLGLPCYLDFETGRNVTNKEYMKKRFVEYGIPTAKHIIVETVVGLEQKICALRFPLIVKPVDCNSSKGVLKVSDKNALFTAVENALLLSRTKTAVIEEFISGEEYTVDFWIENGTPQLLMASKILKFKNRNTFTINGCQTLPTLSQEKTGKLVAIAKKISIAFALDNMPMFMQVIDNGQDIYVLEFSARMGGGTKYRMIERYSGVPIMRLYVDRVLGAIPEIPIQRTSNHISINFIYCKKGIAEEIVGMEMLQKEGVIEEWYQYKPLGTFFDKAENSGDRIAGIMFMGNSDEEISQKVSLAYDSIKILNERKENILLT